jgi:glycosyltransferase involved in cell wall biosynthesis
MSLEKLKIGIVHEWLVNHAGSEKCVESFVNIWNDADIFSLVDFLTEIDRNKILKGKSATTSIIQKLPLSRNHFRKYFFLFPFAIEQFDLSNYNLIISSSHFVAKGVITNAEQLHFCYCHTPVRYAWDLYHQYIKESGLDKNIKGLLAKYFLHKIRIWDSTTSNRVDYFIANSNYIASKIKKIYGREAKVINPPVDIEKFGLESKKDEYYLTASRFVAYKRIDLIVQAFAKMPHLKLIVIGNGEDENKIKKYATKNIEFVGYQSESGLKNYLQKAKAFVFAAIEDFGITVIEAHSCGTPVIALGRGGTAETVIDGVNGLLFKEQTVESIVEAVKKFEIMAGTFDADKIFNTAKNYSRKSFEEKILTFVNEKCINFFNT